MSLKRTAKHTCAPLLYGPLQVLTTPKLSEPVQINPRAGAFHKGLNQWHLVCLISAIKRPKQWTGFLISNPVQWSVSVVAINLDTVLAELHVYHLSDILNAIKSRLWKCAWTSVWWREKSPAWLTCKRAHAGRLDWGLKTSITFAWLSIYQYTDFPFLISSRVPHARVSIIHGKPLFMMRTMLKWQLRLFVAVMYCVVTDGTPSNAWDNLMRAPLPTTQLLPDPSPLNSLWSRFFLQHGKVNRQMVIIYPFHFN